MFQKFLDVTLKQKQMAFPNVEVIEYVPNGCNLLGDLAGGTTCLGLVGNEGEEYDISSYQISGVRSRDR